MITDTSFSSEPNRLNTSSISPPPEPAPTPTGAFGGEARIEQGLNKIVSDLAQSAKVDEGRRNELEGEMEINVRFLARRLDRGVRIEISPPDKLSASAQQDKSTEEIAEAQAALAQLKEQALAIAKIADIHSPALMLPEPEKTSRATDATQPP